MAAIAAVTDRIKLGTGIAQIGSRTPAMLAMNAMGVQAISNGRFVLGLGASGAQVMEGWHGAEFTRPVQRTRETIKIIRMITSGERLAYDGEIYHLPLPMRAGVSTDLPSRCRRSRSTSLRQYRDCGVTTLRVHPVGDDRDARVAGLGQLIDLVADVNREGLSDERAAVPGREHQ